MDIRKESLGLFSNCILFLVKEHEPSKTIFNTIRQGFGSYANAIIKATDGKCSMAQTGSSFDELHLSRFLFDEKKGQDTIYPPIDFDFMISFDEYKILDKSTVDSLDETVCEELRLTSNHFAAMMSSSGPGYVKLLVTNVGREMLRRPNCDIEDDIRSDGFLPNGALKKKSVAGNLEEGVELLYSRLPQYVCSGPALSLMEDEEKGISYDFVYAFPCDTWPEMAINWTKRHRPDEWPPKHVLQSIIEGGCAVVPVGHHLSKKEIQEVEWRVSFNAAERKLSKCLLPLQRACYSLTKLIMKTSLSPDCILTSYHVKNMMFWFCEQRYGKEEDWSVDKQGERILDFIEYIANALANYSIPNYFVPPNNMISHRTKVEIDQTRREVEQVKDSIVSTLFQACIKLHIFENNPSQAGKETSDIQTLLTIYISFVQILYKVGLMNLRGSGSRLFDMSDLSQMKITLSQLQVADIDMDLFVPLQCFANIVMLNRCFRAQIRAGSHAYLAQSVLELLKPIAQSYAQTGKLEEACALYRMMLQADGSSVEKNFPEVHTNLACLYAAMIGTQPKDAVNRKKFLKAKANTHFRQALKLISDSQSLHLGYGNFLLDTKESVSLAIEQFEKAVEIKVPRNDDEALIQLQLPESNTAISEKVHVSGKVAAYYMLGRCYVALDETYKARKKAHMLEEECRGDCVLRQKYPHLHICALSYRKCGLTAKADLLKFESKIYKKCT